MSPGGDSAAERDAYLYRLAGPYLRAVEAGQTPDLQAFLQRHPESAAELAALLADPARLEALRLAEWPTAPPSRAPHPAEPQGTTDERGRPGDPGAGTGARFFGEYELLGEIGRGGMGIVFRARHVPLNRVVALKTVLTGRLADAGELDRFRREAEAVAGLDHPHIVPVYQIGEHDGQHYFSMKLVEGPSLAARVPRLRDSPREAAGLLAAVARAVHHAHQRGILHRDLKPSNILLDAEHRPYVTDFGLAKRVEGGGDHTRTGAIVGTPGYMAPEQARSEKFLSTAVDVYGLGAVLYELLTGRPPFRAKTALDTVLQVLEREPERPRSLNPRADRDLETVCLKCLEKDPRRRYGSAEAVAEDLERWLAGEPIAARRAGRAERIAKWLRRHPAATALSAVSGLAALALVGVAVGLFYNGRLRSSLEETERQRGEAVLERGRFRALKDAVGYARTMSLAQQAWQDSRVERVLGLLDELRPGPGEEDRRGFEWHYLWNLCHSERMTLRGHTGYVLDVTFSPDGDYLASASYDPAQQERPVGEVRVWDTTTGRSLRSHPARATGDYGRVAFSADGQRLAGGGFRALRIWDARSGTEVATLSGCFLPSDIDTASSADGRHLVTALAETGPARALQIRDATTGKVTRTVTVEGEGGLAAALAPDGKLLAAGTAGDGPERTAVGLWDLSTGERVRTFGRHEGWVSSLAFSPDGRVLAAGCWGGAIHLWDTASGRELRAWKGQPGLVLRLRFSPDGTLLASTSNQGRDNDDPCRAVELWSVETGKPVRSFKGHTGKVWGFAFSPDGQSLASASFDGTVKVWEVAADPERFVSDPAPEESHPLAFSPTGERLARANGRTVYVHDARTGEEIFRVDHLGRVLAFSPDGGRLVSVAGSWERNESRLLAQGVKVWDSATGRELASYPLPAGQDLSGVAVSPDGGYLVVPKDGAVRLCEAATGREVRSLPIAAAGLQCVALRRDNRQIATAVECTSSSAEVVIWDLETGAPVHRLAVPRARVGVLAFSPDGTPLALADRSLEGGSRMYEGNLRLWELEGEAHALLLRGHTGFVNAVAFSPDGRRLASGAEDGTVRLWDTDGGEQLLTLGGHPGAVQGLAFRPDGRCLASADGHFSYTFVPARGVERTVHTVRLWEIDPPDPAVRSARAAARLVNSLFERLVRKADVLTCLRERSHLAGPFREIALARAERYVQDPELLNVASRGVVQVPGAEAAACDRALLLAEEACRLGPDNAAYLSTLGVARYRAGRYREAAEALTRCDRRNAASPTGSHADDLAFLVMAQYRSGQRVEAQESFVRLRATMRNPRWAHSPEAIASFREAKRVLEERKSGDGK